MLGLITLPQYPMTTCSTTNWWHSLFFHRSYRGNWRNHYFPLSLRRWVFHGSLLDTEEKDWDNTFTINVKSMFFTSKACVSMVSELNVRVWAEFSVKWEINSTTPGVDFLLMHPLQYAVSLCNHKTHHIPKSISIYGIFWGVHAIRQQLVLLVCSSFEAGLISWWYSTPYLYHILKCPLFPPLSSVHSTGLIPHTWVLSLASFPGHVACLSAWEWGYLVSST